MSSGLGDTDNNADQSGVSNRNLWELRSEGLCHIVIKLPGFTSRPGFFGVFFKNMMHSKYHFNNEVFLFVFLD